MAGVLFDEVSAERIIAAVLFVERLQRGGSVKRRHAIIEPHRLRVVKTPSGGIPARSGDEPGSTMCDVYEWNGSQFVDSGSDSTIHNLSGAAVAGNAYLIAVRIEGPNGHVWLADWEDCAS